MIKNALSHLIEESLFDNIEQSFQEMFPQIANVHNAIHQFMLTAPEMFPTPSKTEEEDIWHTKTAFLTYHWEIFHLAHRSLLEALCAYYNAAFILLRSTLELIIKSAFYECLAHKKFRNASTVLDSNKKGKNLKFFLQSVIRAAPTIAEDLEKTSAGIYDKITPIIDDPKFRPSIATMIHQLSEWGILEGIADPYENIYKKLYRKLSADVHVVPDRTDIGTILLQKPEDLFESHMVMKDQLVEYLADLAKVTDIGIVVTLNVLKENLVVYKELREMLHQTLKDPEYRQLGLKYSPKRIESLLVHEEP